jgi:hypothetical protein
MRTALALLLAFNLVACGDDSEKPKADAAPDKGVDAKAPDTGAPDMAAPDMGTPTVLVSTHTGWQNTSCSGSGCHTLPVTGHTATEPYECASCHGGNGACTPPAAHSQAENCMSCHGVGGSTQKPHSPGFTSNVDCKACHYAAEGTAACPP